MPVRSRESQTLVLAVPRRGPERDSEAGRRLLPMHRLRTPLRTLNQITLPVGHTAATARQHTGPSRRAREHEPSGMGAQLGSKSGRNMPLARPVRGRPWKADGYTDRATGPDAVRYTSVDTATHRPTVTLRDTRRDEKETARRSRFRSQRAVYAGGGRCWVRTNVG
jgi:hypothetical protein